MKKVLLILFLLPLLSNCTQYTAMVGPSLTMVESGNILKASSSLSSSFAMKNMKQNFVPELKSEKICPTVHSSELNQIFFESKQYSKSDYDCIVSVSGGKDSYYQTHFVKEELKLNPLLVTYNGNNFSEEGWHNLIRMKDVFKCDHLIVNPSANPK